jgi:hypothetical protein
MIAVTDFLSNVFLLKDWRLFKTYLNAHGKLITDLCWFFTYDHGGSEPVPYFATSSMDGALKLWSLTDQLVPLFDQFTSKVGNYYVIITLTHRNGYIRSTGMPQSTLYSSMGKGNSSLRRSCSSSITRY